MPPDDRPTWKRRRQTKRRDQQAERRAEHQRQLRLQGARGGARGAAAAEWDILRQRAGALPEQARDAAWQKIAMVLRQLSDTL